MANGAAAKILRQRKNSSNEVYQKKRWEPSDKVSIAAAPEYIAEPMIIQNKEYSQATGRPMILPKLDKIKLLYTTADSANLTTE